MKKIGICTLNSKYIHASLAPWCLYSGVREYVAVDVETVVWESTINQKIEVILEELLAHSFDFVGFSCYIWNISFTLQVISALKARCPALVVVLGGPEVSYNQREILEKNEFVDFVLSGEGERPFAQLVESFCGLRNKNEVLGLSYRSNEGEIIVSPSYQTMEVPPSPYCEAYFQQLQGKIAYMESSRGCPFSCAFCLSGAEKGVRYFDLELVKGNILALAQSGTKTIKFIDRTFNSNVKHANAILEFILVEYGKGIPTSICCHFEIAGDILKESTLLLIEQMPKGAIQLEIGMQSFCEKTLESVGRVTNNQVLCENIRRLVSFGNHHLHIDLIAGLPYEDLEEFKKSFNIGYELQADMLQLGFLKVLQGSEIWGNPSQFPCNYSDNPPYQVISTPWLTEKEIELLAKVEDTVDRLYNSGRFTLTLAYLLQVTGETPFDLLEKITEQMVFSVSPSLDIYTDLLYDVTKEFSGVNSTVLRDKMLLDRIQTNSTGNIPHSLMVKDGTLRTLKIFLEGTVETACPPEGKRFVGILYSTNQGVFVDYPASKKKNHHYQERFLCRYVNLTDILEGEQ